MRSSARSVALNDVPGIIDLAASAIERANTLPASLPLAYCNISGDEQLVFRIVFPSGVSTRHHLSFVTRAQPERKIRFGATLARSGAHADVMEATFRLCLFQSYSTTRYPWDEVVSSLSSPLFERTGAARFPECSQEPSACRSPSSRRTSTSSSGGPSSATCSCRCISGEWRSCRMPSTIMPPEGEVLRNARGPPSLTLFSSLSPGP